MTDGGDGEKSDSDLTFEASGETRWGRFKISGRGAYGIGAAAATALLAELIFLDPLHNPQHFIAALFTTAVSMFIFGTATQAGRVNDLRDEIKFYRREINRMAAEKKAFEEEVIRRRLSSADGQEPKKLPPPPAKR